MSAFHLNFDVQASEINTDYVLRIPNLVRAELCISDNSKAVNHDSVRLIFYTREQMLAVANELDGHFSDKGKLFVCNGDSENQNAVYVQTNSAAHGFGPLNALSETYSELNDGSLDIHPVTVTTNLYIDFPNAIYYFR